MRELKLQDNGASQPKNQSEEQWKPKEEDVDPGLFAVSGVYFTCPLLGPEVLPRHEIEKNILQFLLAQPPEELGMSACLMIHSCNKGREKVFKFRLNFFHCVFFANFRRASYIILMGLQVEACVDTLCKYLNNIIQNPSESKFHKIKCSNKVFQEKVASLVGVPQFLQAAGFHKQVLPAEGGGEPEEFYVFTMHEEAVSRLTVSAKLSDFGKLQNCFQLQHHDPNIAFFRSCATRFKRPAQSSPSWTAISKY